MLFSSADIIIYQAEVLQIQCTTTLRAMLRDHRGLNIERRIKAAFWWCYMHSPEPLSAKELLKVMPTDRSIAEIYKRLSPQKKIES